MPRVAAVLILASLLSPVALATGDIVLRSAVEPAEAWVGQRVVLEIDVLSAEMHSSRLISSWMLLQRVTVWQTQVA